jgi:plasmid stabilization system protein ParE
MNRRVSFHPLAEQELNEAASYYDAASPGLGAAFLDEVERAIKQILEYPEATPLVNRVVHRKLVRRFPYSVMYSVQTDTIRILAIANQKWRPFYWRGRKRLSRGTAKV